MGVRKFVAIQLKSFIPVFRIINKKLFTNKIFASCKPFQIKTF